MTSFSFSVLNFTKSKGVAFPGVGDPMGAAMSIAAGISSFLGTRLFTRALEAGGSVGMVSAVTGSYPAVAFVLSVAMLGENIQTNKVAGLFLALASAVAFSMEPEAPTEEEKIKAG